MRSIAQNFTKRESPLRRISDLVLRRRQASRTSDLFVSTTTTAPTKDQPWLLKAFVAYDTNIVRLVPGGKTAVVFVEIALKAELCDLGRVLSWKALATPRNAREYWLDVSLERKRRIPPVVHEGVERNR
jgi:hypothetical protein